MLSRLRFVAVLVVLTATLTTGLWAKNGTSGVTAIGPVTVNLVPGWNGVAFQCQKVTSVSASSVIAGMAVSDGAGPYAFSNFTLDAINAGEGARRGFWIFATAAGSFTYSGDDDGKGNVLNLKNGYNLVSFSTSVTIPSASLVTQKAGQTVPLSSVLLTQFFEITANGLVPRDVSTGASLAPGLPYWIFSNGDVTLTFSAGPTFTVERVSLDSNGNQLNVSSVRPTTSSDGSVIAFEVDGAAIPSDTNNLRDVYSVNRQTGILSRVSVGNQGQQATSPAGTLIPSVESRISADGRSVAFASNGFGLKTDQASGIFVRDLAGSLSLLNPPSNAPEGATWQGNIPALSADGQRAAFLDFRQAGGSKLAIVQRPALSVTFPITANAGSGESVHGLFSADGKFLIFEGSPDSFLVNRRVFVRDLTSGATSEVSVSSAGVSANNRAGSGNADFEVGISGDGRFAVFSSSATNLVPNDTNNAIDVFLRDRQTNTTTRISTNSNGDQVLGGDSFAPSISNDGRFVAFESSAGNLVPSVSAGQAQVFAKDLQTGAVVLISRNVAGQSTPGAGNPQITGDGKFVVFDTGNSNVVPNDTNNARDIFLSRNVLAP